MPEGSPALLEYRAQGAVSPKPTHHSSLAGCAWAAMILAAAYKANVVAYAYHRSPTYPWARFSRNVGNPETFIHIELFIYAAGAFIAILALIPPNRKRWAAWLALAAHLFCLVALGPLSYRGY